MLRPYACGGPTRNAGDDRDGVPRLYRRVALRELPDVAVVHVHVDKAAQPAIVRKEVRPQGRVLPGEPLEQLPHAGALQLECIAAAHEGTQRRRDQDCHCHTAFRSSLVICSSAKLPRSSARTQLFNSVAVPRLTPTIT